MSRSLAAAELFTAAILWGFSFVGTIWAMEVFNPFALTFLRFFLASFLLIPVLCTRHGRAQVRDYGWLAFWPAVLLAGTLLIQTWGLRYTTATKSGFITTLYVVLMPFLESYMTQKRLPKAVWACVVLAFVGTALIVNVGLGEINKGDLLTLITAFLATGQIFVIGQVSKRVDRPFLFNLVEALWCTLFCLPFAIEPEFWQKLAAVKAWPPTALFGVLSLAFGSTVVAFSLQVRAQRRLSPTVSSLLFLLESPFAMMFSVWLLKERLGPFETMGCLLIFVAAVTASLSESQRAKSS